MLMGPLTVGRIPGTEDDEEELKTLELTLELTGLDDTEDDGRARRVNVHGVHGIPVCPVIDNAFTVIVNAP
jgi:hypothetical protein